MHKAGEDNQNYYSGLFKHISQTVQGIKEVKISCKERYFVEEYAKCGQGYVNAVQKYSLYNQVPKLLIEPICVTVLIGYMLYMGIIGAVEHKKLYDDFISKYGIDLNDLSSFDIEEAAEFEEQNQRYPFDEYDDAFYDMEPLETYLKKFIRENIKDF